MSPDPIEYAKAYVPIIFTPKLSDGARNLFHWYKYRGNSLGVVWWPHNSVAKQLRISKSTLYRRLNELKKVGLIKVNRFSKRGCEVVVMPFADDVIARLKAPTRWPDAGEEGLSREPDSKPSSQQAKCQKCDEGVSKMTLHIRYKRKHENKTSGDGAAAADEGRLPFDDVFSDPLVQASMKPRAAPSLKQRPEPPPEPKPVIDDLMLARWRTKDWVKAFVTAMRAEGFDVAHAHRANAIQAQMRSITNILFERLGRKETYRFLIEWLPKNYTDMCRAVLRKDPDARNPASLAYLEVHVGSLIDRFRGSNETEDSNAGIWYPNPDLLR